MIFEIAMGIILAGIILMFLPMIVGVLFFLIATPFVFIAELFNGDKK